MQAPGRKKVVSGGADLPAVEWREEREDGWYDRSAVVRKVWV